MNWTLALILSENDRNDLDVLAERTTYALNNWDTAVAHEGLTPEDEPAIVILSNYAEPKTEKAEYIIVVTGKVRR